MQNWTAIVRRLYPEAKFGTFYAGSPALSKRLDENPSLAEKQITVDDIVIEWNDETIPRPTPEEIRSREAEALALLTADDEKRGRRKAFERLWPAEKIISLADDEKAMMQMMADALKAR